MYLKTVTLSVCFILFLSFAPRARAVETTRMALFDNQFFRSELYYPTSSQFKDGEEFPFTIDIMPKVDTDIDVDSIKVILGGGMPEWEYEWSSITMHAQTHYNVTHTFILNSSSVSFIGGRVTFQGACWIHDLLGNKTQRYVFGSNFRLFGDPWARQELQESLDSLNQTYQNLLQSSAQNDATIGFYEILVLTLGIATTILTLTTIYLSIKKRAEKKVEKT